MWQRSQTVYLLLVIILLSLTLVFPFATYPSEPKDITFSLFGLSENTAKVEPWFPYYISIALSIGLAAFSVTQFKNRKRQMNLGKINYFVILLTIVMVFVDSGTLASKLNIAEDSIRYDLGVYFPVAAFAFVFLANRGIKKDEDLIKSVDRLR